MRTRLILAAATVGLAALVGCTPLDWRAPVQPPRGALFTAYSAPITTDFADTPVQGRTGEASTLYVRIPVSSLLQFAFGDASLETAARRAGISQIHYADYEILEVLGVFGEFKVRVHGE